jgi:hypothetical protein
MPVNHQLNLIFVHIPKAAGSTVEHFIKEQTGEPWDLWGKYHNDARHFERYPQSGPVKRINPDRFGGKPLQPLYHHLVLEDMVSILGTEQADRYHKLAIFRNPWDRLVSHYEYLRQTGERGGTEGRTFIEWFEARLVTPQILPYLRVEGGVPRDLTLLNFDRFSDEFGDFMQQLGLNWDGGVHEKRSERSDYRQYYTDLMAEKLAEECRSDIEHFGFRF